MALHKQPTVPNTRHITTFSKYTGKYGNIHTHLHTCKYIYPYTYTHMNMFANIHINIYICYAFLTVGRAAFLIVPNLCVTFDSPYSCSSVKFWWFLGNIPLITSLHVAPKHLSPIWVCFHRLVCTSGTTAVALSTVWKAICKLSSLADSEFAEARNSISSAFLISVLILKDVGCVSVSWSCV